MGLGRPVDWRVDWDRVAPCWRTIEGHPSATPLVERRTHETDRGTTNRPWRGWDVLWTEIRDEIPKVREQVEDDFRRLLGMGD